MWRFFRDLPYFLLDRANLSIFLAALIVPLGEVHKAWENVRMDVDVFLLKDMKLDIQWVVLHVCNQVQLIILTYLLWVFAAAPHIPKVLRNVFLALFVFSWVELIMYFVNFKTGGYGWIYYGLAGLLIILNRKKRLKPIGTNIV